MQGLLLDSHFAVEQEARFRAGLPISFNGTAGVWNRAAIENGGGWTGDTLTEDLDLSMRCVMQGLARARWCPISKCRANCRQTAAAWRAQQARWTKGHAQVRPQIAAAWSGPARMPLWKKAAMTLQMCQFAFYTLAFASAAIIADPDVYGRSPLSRRRDAGPDRDLPGPGLLDRLSLSGPAHAGPGT